MKSIILSVTFLFCFSGLQAQLRPDYQENKVKWYNIEEAVKMNKTIPKKFMIDVYTDWCGWCKKMDKETFNNPVIAEYLNKYYYPIKFNAESTKPIVFMGKTYVNEGDNGPKSSHQFAVMLLQGKMSYPSIAYLTDSLQYLGAIPGYKTAPQMETILVYIAENKFKTMPFEEFEKTFKGKIQ